MLAAFLAWSTGLAGLGAAVGYELFNTYAVHAAAPVTTAPAKSTTAGQGATAVVVPDVEGLDRQAALQAIADAGFDPSEVTFNSKPYGTEAGTVVAQDPLGGTRSPKTIALTVATPVRMPQVIGRTSEAAGTALEALGVPARMLLVYAPGSAVGTVISSAPAAGAPLTGAATLRVSSAPAAAYLSELETIESDCSTGSAIAAGQTFDHSVTCSAGGDPRTVTWAIGRHADGAQVTLGISDDSPPGSAASVVLLGDGRVIRTVPVKFGSARSVTVDLRGVVQFSVRMTGTDGATVVLGDARVIGSASGIDQVVAASGQR